MRCKDRLRNVWMRVGIEQRGESGLVQRQGYRENCWSSGHSSGLQSLFTVADSFANDHRLRTGPFIGPVSS